MYLLLNTYIYFKDVPTKLKPDLFLSRSFFSQPVNFARQHFKSGFLQTQLKISSLSCFQAVRVRHDLSSSFEELRKKTKTTGYCKLVSKGSCGLDVARGIFKIRNRQHFVIKRRVKNHKKLFFTPDWLWQELS